MFKDRNIQTIGREIKRKMCNLTENNDDEGTIMKNIRRTQG